MLTSQSWFAPIVESRDRTNAAMWSEVRFLYLQPGAHDFKLANFDGFPAGRILSFSDGPRTNHPRSLVDIRSPGSRFVVLRPFARAPEHCHRHSRRRRPLALHCESNGAAPRIGLEFALMGMVNNVSKRESRRFPRRDIVLSQR